MGIVLLVTLHGASTAGAASALAETNREWRVPFRDIVQQHPSFPQDTYLYLINPPYLLDRAAPSMFFFRYGSDVSIGTVKPNWLGSAPEIREARLRDHQNSFVYYYDDSNRRHEVQVDRVAQTVSVPTMPLAFQGGINVNGYEVTGTQINHGDALVLLLYWKAAVQIGKDYTVFVHLVDRNGQVLVGDDNQPQNGLAPTTKWKKDELVVDPHILPITSDVPAGNDYRLEIGLYYLPTMERLSILDQAQRPVGDTLVIQPFSVLN